eukprot:3458546-Amphidinium_carterae.1
MAKFPNGGRRGWACKSPRDCKEKGFGLQIRTLRVLESRTFNPLAGIGDSWPQKRCNRIQNPSHWSQTSNPSHWSDRNLHI